MRRDDGNKNGGAPPLPVVATETVKGIAAPFDSTVAGENGARCSGGCAGTGKIHRASETGRRCELQVVLGRLPRWHDADEEPPEEASARVNAGSAVPLSGIVCVAGFASSAMVSVAARAPMA